MKVAPAVSLQVQKEYAIENPLTMYRASGIVQMESGIRPLPSGNFQVVSLSRTGLSHLYNPRYEECNCEAGKQGMLCVHAIAFLIRRAQMFDNAKQDAVKANAPRVALIERRLRTEWVEELDLQ